MNYILITLIIVAIFSIGYLIDKKQGKNNGTT